MFGWLRGLFRPRRCVFKYWDGTRNRRGDPLLIFRVIEEVCPDLDESLRTIHRDPKAVPVGPLRETLVTEQKAAAAKLVGAAAAAFDLKPLDDAAGLTEAEMVAVLSAYRAWMFEASEAAAPKQSWPGAGSDPAS